MCKFYLVLVSPNHTKQQTFNAIMTPSSIFIAIRWLGGSLDIYTDSSDYFHLTSLVLPFAMRADRDWKLTTCFVRWAEHTLYTLHSTKTVNTEKRMDNKIKKMFRTLKNVVSLWHLKGIKCTCMWSEPWVKVLRRWHFFYKCDYK